MFEHNYFLSDLKGLVKQFACLKLETWSSFWDLIEASSSTELGFDRKPRGNLTLFNRWNLQYVKSVLEEIWLIGR